MKHGLEPNAPASDCKRIKTEPEADPQQRQGSEGPAAAEAVMPGDAQQAAAPAGVPVAALPQNADDHIIDLTAESDDDDSDGSQEATAAGAAAGAAGEGVTAATPRTRAPWSKHSVQALIDSLASSSDPAAPQQLQLVQAWVELVFGSSDLWTKRRPIGQLLLEWEALHRHILARLKAGAVDNAAAQQECARAASLLQLPQVAAAVSAGQLGRVEGKVQKALAALVAAAGCTATLRQPPQPAAAAAAAAGGDGSSSAGLQGQLTLGELQRQCLALLDPRAPEKLGCRGLACLAKLLSAPKADIKQMQVSALLPHLDMLLQHFQLSLPRRAVKGGSSSSSSVSAHTRVLRLATAVLYIQGLSVLLPQPLVARQFSSPEQQQQALQLLAAALPQFEAEYSRVKRAQATQAYSSARLTQPQGLQPSQRMRHTSSTAAAGRAVAAARGGGQAAGRARPAPPTAVEERGAAAAAAGVAAAGMPLVAAGRRAPLHSTQAAAAAAAGAAEQQQDAALVLAAEARTTAAATAPVPAAVAAEEVQLQQPTKAVAAAAAAAASPRGRGRPRKHTLQQLCDSLGASSDPAAQQQLQLVKAWARAAFGRSVNPKQLLLRELLAHWGALERHILGRLAAGRTTRAAAQSEFVCVASLLQLPQVATVKAPVLRDLQRKVQQQLAALRAARGSGTPAQPPQPPAAAAGGAGAATAAAAAAAAATGGDVSLEAGAAAAAAAAGLPSRAAASSPAAAAALATGVAAAAAAAGFTAADTPQSTQPAAPAAPAVAPAVAPAATAAAGQEQGESTPPFTAEDTTSLAAHAAPTPATGGSAAAGRQVIPPSPPAAAAAALPAALTPAAPAAPAAGAAASDAAAAAAAAGGATLPPDPPLRVAERHLLQLYRAHLAPGRDQLLRFRQAMRGLAQLAAGHDRLVGFWADYEWVVAVASDPSMQPADWQEAFDTLLDNALQAAA